MFDLKRGTSTTSPRDWRRDI